MRLRRARAEDVEPLLALINGYAARGLLLDEWSEIIPGTDVQTGLTLHHDRPNTEAPQSMQGFRRIDSPADKWNA